MKMSKYEWNNVAGNFAFVKHNILWASDLPGIDFTATTLSNNGCISSFNSRLMTLLTLENHCGSDEYVCLIFIKKICRKRIF